MAKYEKWLGAGLGWMLTGNPLGGLLGFIAGAIFEQGEPGKTPNVPSAVSEFEVNLMVLASYLIKIDGAVSVEEVAFTQGFLNTHFEEKFHEERAKILNHCLQHDYDLNAACGQIRLYTTPATKIQVIHFLFDLASCDGTLTEQENYFIFRVAGYLNINDVDFRRIKNEQVVQSFSAYEILGVRKEMSFAEIRTTYRKLVLKYHPDRNKGATEAEKKNLSLKFQQVKEAYEKIRSEREV